MTIKNINAREKYKLEEDFEDTKLVFRIRISKNRKHNGQKKKNRKKGKQRFTEHIHKTKDRVT